MKTTKKNDHRRAWTGALLILALLLLASCVPAPVTNGTETGTGTSGEKPEIINFDKASAAKAEIYPEYTMDVRLTGSDGKTLRSDSVLKADGGRLKSRISFDYKSTMPRDIALLYFINGIPQKLSVDGKEAEYYNVFSLPSGKTFDLSCAPDGVLPDKNAVVSLVLVRSGERALCHAGNSLRLEDTLIFHLADVSGLGGTKENVSAVGDYLSIKDMAERRGIPTDKEIEDAKKTGLTIKKEEYVAEVEAYVERMSELDFPITVVNAPDTTGVLSQESAVTVNYNESDRNQVYFEAAGIPGMKNRTTVFLGNSPIPAFDGKNTVEWQCEKGYYFNVGFSASQSKEYFESSIFAVTLFDGGKNCAVTNDMLFVNTTAVLDMNKINMKMFTELYDGNGKTAGGTVRKYEGGDLSYACRVRYSYPIRTGAYVFALIDGAPVNTLLDGKEGMFHQISLKDGDDHRMNITVPESAIKSPDFVLNVCVSERYTGFYHMFLEISNIDVLTKTVYYSSDGAYHIDENDHKNKGVRRTVMTLTENEKSGSYFTRFPVGSDARVFYHGRCTGEDTVSRSFAFFNGELIPFENGETVREWSGDNETYLPMPITVPAGKMKNGGELRVVTTKRVNGKYIEIYGASILLGVGGEAKGDPVTLFTQKSEYMTEISGEHFMFSQRISASNIGGDYKTRDKALNRIAAGKVDDAVRSFDPTENVFWSLGKFKSGVWQILKESEDAIRISSYRYLNPYIIDF